MTASIVAAEQTRGVDAPGRVNVLGVGIMPLDLMRAVRILDRWRNDGRRDYVCCVCVHGVTEAQHDPAVLRALNGAGLATTDGMPLVWWCRGAGFAQASRVYGPDLLERLCAFGLQRGYRHYFYGGTPAVLERLVARLQARHPGLVVAGCRAPPFRPPSAEEDAADIAAINAARPDFVWIGLGMPKQEKWMAAHVGRIEAAALLGVGAAFDFHAGTKPRAPLWMQRSGLEWLFRLASEPRRLGRRYLVGNTQFLWLAAQQILRWRSFRIEAG